MNPQKDVLNGKGLMAIVQDLLQLPEGKGAVDLEKGVADKKNWRDKQGLGAFL